MFKSVFCFSLSTQLTWRCKNCDTKGIGPSSEARHHLVCERKRAEERIETINGFTNEVIHHQNQIREVDRRFWDYVTKMQNEK